MQPLVKCQIRLSKLDKVFSERGEKKITWANVELKGTFFMNE